MEDILVADLKNNNFKIADELFEFTFNSGFEINSKFHPYKLRWMNKNYLSHIQELAKDQRNFFIIDKNVYKIFFDQKVSFQNLYLVEAVEDSKSIKGIINFLEYMSENKVNKGSNVVCVGGGIVQDITSFSCGAFKRGIDWTFFPTTFLAMCDSCIGSKSGINFGDGKNQLGLFFPPKEIILVEDFLSTLPEDVLMSGIGEALKLSITGGNEAFDKFKDLFLSKDLKRNLPNLIDLSLSVKKTVVEFDEFESNVRKSMNYGHTFAHAIEKITSFGIPHGFAVTFGLILANRLSYKLGFLLKDDMHVIDSVAKKVLSLYDLNQISSFNFESIGDVMLTDKKAVNDSVYFVLVSKIGHTFFLEKKIDIQSTQLIKEVIKEVFDEILIG